MKNLFFILIVFSLLLVPHITKTKELSSSYINNTKQIKTDTSIVQDTVVVNLNVYYDVDNQYYNIEEDSTKRNIFKVIYLETNVVVYKTIDFKLDFWSLNSPKDLKILDTIEFYPNY